jgi:O-antigen/teichoic acid export membrane protein
MATSTKAKTIGWFRMYAGSGAEQIVFAAQSFLFTVVAARLTTTEQFGRFVTATACVLLCFSLSSTLVNTPALVLLHKKYSGSQSDYLNSLRVLALGFGLLSPLLFIPILTIVNVRIEIFTMFCMAVLHYSMLSYDLQRRWANSTGHLKALFVQTLFASIVALLTSITMSRNGVLTDATIQLAFGTPFLVVAWTAWLRDITTQAVVITAGHLWGILSNHWMFAWALIISMLLYWVSTQGYFLIAARLLPANDLGGLRTAQALCSVLNIAFLVFENRATPLLAKLEVTDGTVAVKNWSSSAARKMFTPLVAGGLLLVPVLWFVHKFVYGDKYASYSYLVVFFLAYLVFHGLSRPYAIGLKAIEKNRVLLYGYGLSAAACICLSYPLINFGGVSGAAIGFMLSSLLLLFVLRAYFR